MKIQCMACGEGYLHAASEHVKVEYRGNVGFALNVSHVCDVCGASLFLDSDLRENKRAWIRFKKQFDMIPLGCEIQAMRVRAGLTQKEAGSIFGGGPVAFSKYESDDLVPDEAMIGLIKLSIAYPETVERLKRARLEHVKINTFLSEADSIVGSDWERQQYFEEDLGGESAELSKSRLSFVLEPSVQEFVWLQ